MKDDLTPYRWEDHVVTPRRAAANLVASVLIMVVAVFAGPDRTDMPSGSVASPVAAPVPRATERAPCLALIARPPMPPHRARQHLL